MTYTTIPSVKGQITIPASLREKYNIGKETPILVEDKGKGVITLKIMHLIAHDDITFYEDEKETGLVFQKGIDPNILIDAIKKIDG